ncbi:MAG: HAMP domain-containing histidine kinase [Acidobacteria bacterium]|nr:HAMP domain-containing histidine kinase [Acidobacteriota bacterium]
MRSNLTCPLVVEGRRVGVLFRSSRLPRAYTERHVRVHDAIAERLGQAVLNAYRLEQVAEANRAYAETIGFVSHELKAPIASMLADTDVLLAGYAGPIADSQRARLEAIRRKGTGLLDLVRDYLDLARVEGGLQIQVQPEVDVAGALVDQAVELVRATMEARGMRIELARDAAGPIACDPDLVRIILVNLVSNAVKYGRDGGLVRIEAERREGKLAIAVWNEGPGFDAAARGKLFRRFGRLDDPELKSRAGTGLGLYTSWRIARLHGGSIDADSEPGRWARFTLTLPVAPTADREPCWAFRE